MPAAAEIGLASCRTFHHISVATIWKSQSSYHTVRTHPSTRPGPQWGRQLGSSSTLFPGGLAAPFCRSLCSAMARFKVRPLMDPRCHLQMSPFSMSWMCCTMRLMATGERRMICKEFMLNKLAEKHLLSHRTLTHVVNSPWNDDIYILLCLREKTNVFRYKRWVGKKAHNRAVLVCLINQLVVNYFNCRSSYLQANKTLQKQAWRMLCTEWESVPGPSLCSCLAELQIKSGVLICRGNK